MEELIIPTDEDEGFSLPAIPCQTSSNEPTEEMLTNALTEFEENSSTSFFALPWVVLGNTLKHMKTGKMQGQLNLGVLESDAGVIGSKRREEIYSCINNLENFSGEGKFSPARLVERKDKSFITFDFQGCHFIIRIIKTQYPWLLNSDVYQFVNGDCYPVPNTGYLDFQGVII